MSKKKTFIENQRNLTPFDLRTELLLDSLLQNNIDDFDIVIKPNGLFYRKFSKDKMSINLDSIDSDILNIEISRDSFYDILPESISHNYRNSDSFSNPVDEFKTRKKEEKEARNFFNPIENEFFRFRHEIEKNESFFFSNLNANGIVDIIKTILVFEEEIPDELVVKMFYALLQLKDNSNQNIDEIVSILEQIINEKVTYETSYIKLENVNDKVDDSNDLIMGINTTLESSERIFLKKYNFIIGPLKKSKELSKYFQNQLMESFLNNFFNLFLPFHAQYSFEVTLNKKDQMFSMDEKQYKSRLGISTIL
ncbi:hypothetical protein FIA58_018195 [Flavobacterium jejuense]|uniref:Type VI secretion system baseplate subunit TssG n=1 Tax=Flavobacterium jejuense TaxID=1544455 RepID=A0ABX0IWQ7_9FLAO|nr:hypothetical protein [Flavobacterium jejuense]NHN27616.1 hypothetical protein [Flavobacterium jejuense]